MKTKVKGQSLSLTLYFYSFKTVSESEVAQLSPTLFDPMDCSLPGSSVHGILQARVLEWVAIVLSRGSSWPRDWTQVSCIADRRFYRLSHQGSQRKWNLLSHVQLFATPWTNSPGQNTGVGSLSLLQGIFPTQGSNPDLPHCRWIL